jgi:hypothetical protein
MRWGPDPDSKVAKVVVVAALVEVVEKRRRADILV